jgi:23S rRNA (uracil1939-C5)-methyltransferase
VGAELPGVLPGERVEAEVTHVSGRGRIFAMPRSILRSSPDRVPDRCPHFLICGGCDFLHLSIEKQHELKRRTVIDALGLSEALVDPVVGAPEPTGYRALAKLVVGPDRTLGSYKPRTHEVADMSGCLVHSPLVESIAEELRVILRELPPPMDLRYVVIRASLAEARAIVTLIAASEGAIAPRRITERLSHRSDVARIVLHVNSSEGDAIFGPGPDLVLLDRGAPNERIGAVSQSLEAGAFAQINPRAAEILYRLVSNGLDPRQKRVLDLYSGSGGIALTLAQDGAKLVHGIERSGEGIAAAARSAEALGLADRVTFRHALVEEALVHAPEVDAIVINPPRSGAPESVIREIARRAPIALAYVSCSPTSLARNLASLRALGPMELRRVTPVDLFPQTRHVETLVLVKLG